ncbi:3-phosphoshikimate 1-carboxyvinyltransferase [Desulfonatronovibrio magnus]|uniref:3-phosphoshikimate 1-carboxyvinyltransferase n=1 Tax=Desulfonatronovibrio magnus TaxID=698827 RepID=UPI0005EB0167|nr:3-phosphoshikimate 1-carboxyvinyltransferase [Desulfonatronovibrio magnus]
MNSISHIILNAPSSKSMSHRAMLMAGLAQGESILSNVLDSDDLTHTRMCLEAMGAQFDSSGSRLVVKGLGGKVSAAPGQVVGLDVGESGTTCRLIAGIAAAGKGSFKISGRGRMHQRPIKSLADALMPFNIIFSYQEAHGCPPVIIETQGLPGGELSISLEESSQYLSGILLGSIMAEDEMVINLTGSKVVSWPYVNLTLQVMDEFGCGPEIQVEESGKWVSVSASQVKEAKPGKIRFIVRPLTVAGRDYQVEGDFSNASYLLAAGALGPRPTMVTGLNPQSRQGDRVILDILQKMGARVEISNKGVLVEGARLKGVDLDMGASPDLVPTVAVLASQARGITKITNVAHLRIKESDRLEGVFNEVSRTGCKCSMLDDGLIIDPEGFESDREIKFSTYDDHRMAMSLSLYQLTGINVVLDNPDCVKKSFPGFWDEWSKVVSGMGKAEGGKAEG